jgi:hypothetical protein
MTPTEAWEAGYQKARALGEAVEHSPEWHLAQAWPAYLLERLLGQLPPPTSPGDYQIRQTLSGALARSALSLHEEKADA